MSTLAIECTQTLDCQTTSTREQLRNITAIITPVYCNKSNVTVNSFLSLSINNKTVTLRWQIQCAELEQPPKSNNRKQWPVGSRNVDDDVVDATTVLLVLFCRPFGNRCVIEQSCCLPHAKNTNTNGSVCLRWQRWAAADFRPRKIQTSQTDEQVLAPPKAEHDDNNTNKQRFRSFLCVHTFCHHLLSGYNLFGVCIIGSPPFINTCFVSSNNRTFQQQLLPRIPRSSTMKFSSSAAAALLLLQSYSTTAFSFHPARVTSRRQRTSSLSMVLEKPKPKKLPKIEQLKIDSNHLVHPLIEVSHSAMLSQPTKLKLCLSFLPFFPRKPCTPS